MSLFLFCANQHFPNKTGPLKLPQEKKKNSVRLFGREQRWVEGVQEYTVEEVSHETKSL